VIRNIAFFLSSNNTESKNYKKAKKHFDKLASEYEYSVLTRQICALNIHIIYEEKCVFEESNGVLKILLGQIGNNSIEYDRFLKLQIDDGVIEIENDYAGSIPVYYSNREYFSLSNIEPCTVFDSGTTQKDLSFENLYGFMRYMHFILDETVYNHIFSMLPDSKYHLKLQNLTVDHTDLKTVKSSNENCNLSDKEVADKLNDLNDYLVSRSLGKHDQIILPLSSGYDSRMILASLSKNKDMAEKLYCYTYGSIGSVEVEAARRLTDLFNIHWDFIDLPCKFLSKKYIDDIYNVFGSSLHMHGMYQLEFFNEIKKKISINDNSCLTSGFMTGVPAGQHNGLLKITSNSRQLTDAMNKFGQSQYWLDSDLNKMSIFEEQDYIEKAEQKFRQAFDRFDGEIHQKSVMFDVWTRQRNFIGYYPRTLEWVIPTASPHMCIEYINFFMSISKKHLHKRYAVEQMFKYHYPDLSKIVSNSNGLKAIGNQYENAAFFISKVLKCFNANSFLPKKYANNDFAFDLLALKNSGKDGVFPILEDNMIIKKFIQSFTGEEFLKKLYQKAINGDIAAYCKMVTLQSIALSFYHIGEEE